MFTKVPIGATGAVGTYTPDAPDFTVARASAGTYTLGYPTGKDAQIDVSIVSAAGTVVTAQLTAQDATAGSATLVTRAFGGAATDPASGDVLRIRISVKQD